MTSSGDGGAVNPVSDTGGALNVSPQGNPDMTVDARHHWLLQEERRLLQEERRLLAVGAHAVDHFKAGTAGTFWSQLNTVDFMNSSLQFAALAVLCLFPFLVIVSAEAGGDARHALIARLGLNKEAARDLNQLMSAGHNAVSDLSIFGAVLVLLGALGIASTLQLWYQRVYDQPPARKWTRQLADRLLWLAGLVIYLVLQDFAWIQVEKVDVGRALFYLATFGLAMVFYWWTPHVLLLGQVSWRKLFPVGVATAICVTGLGAFSALLFSAQIISSNRDYGMIGVVMILLSYLIGFGVCLHLGAVIGRMWNNRHPSMAAES
jgi:membrane protein